MTVERVTAAAMRDEGLNGGDGSKRGERADGGSAVPAPRSRRWSEWGKGLTGEEEEQQEWRTTHASLSHLNA